MEIMKINQMKILDMKTTITEHKNFMEKFNSRLCMAVEKINTFEV